MLDVIYDEFCEADSSSLFAIVRCAKYCSITKNKRIIIATALFSSEIRLTISVYWISWIIVFV